MVEKEKETTDLNKP